MRQFLLSGLCAAVLLTGCKKKDAGGPTAGPPAAAGDLSAADKAAVGDLKRFGMAFHSYCAAKMLYPFTAPVPADMTALAPYFNNDPNDPTLLKFKDGTYKAFWNAPPTQQIIACEKDAETKGGWVTTRLGDAQKKTAAEIQQDVRK